MELSAGLAWGAIPVALLIAAAGLARAYNRLQERHRRCERDRSSYLEVLEGSNDALFVINFVNGRIYQANERAARLLGYARAELEQLTIFALHRQEDLQRSARRIADAWEHGGHVYEDIPLVRRDGALIPVESSTRVTSYNGRPAIILFARDITERLALRAQVEEQQAVVARQNADLLSSIRYARRIQRAVLPEPQRLQELFPESFILHRPRDIVSGDLCWFAEAQGRIVVAVADCTGHGVPGALLSLIGASLLQEVVAEQGRVEPGAVLDALREGFVQMLNRHEEADQRDGMNLGLAVIDPQRMTLDFAGAYHPLWLIREGAIIELKGDRMPIGAFAGEQRPFNAMSLALERGDRIHLFSDGLADQFGGPQGKKLRSAGLKQWLLETSVLPIDDQHQALSDRFRLWKGGQEQVDDVLLIGIQV
jgi:PAS domain S-box-containing protein